MRGVPLPFMILILAGAVSLVSIIITSQSTVSMTRDNPLKIQMVEQERMAALYFRVLSWLSDLTPRNAEPEKANPQAPRAPQVVKTPRRGERTSKVEWCMYHMVHRMAGKRLHDFN